MPPIHPAIVHFPVALGIVAIVSDSAAIILEISSLYAVGQWAIAGAAVGGGFAILAGYADMKRDALKETTHEIVHLHLKIGWIVGACLLTLALWRWLNSEPGLGYLIGGWLMVAVLLLQAWLGGEMVYAHGAGVAAAGQGTEPAEKAQQPSLRFYRTLMRKPAKSNEHDDGKQNNASGPY